MDGHLEPLSEQELANLVSSDALEAKVMFDGDPAGAARQRLINALPGAVDVVVNASRYAPLDKDRIAAAKYIIDVGLKGNLPDGKKGAFDKLFESVVVEEVKAKGKN